MCYLGSCLSGSAALTKLVDFRRGATFFFPETSFNTTLFAEAVPAADSHIQEPAYEEQAQVALHSPSVGLH